MLNWIEIGTFRRSRQYVYVMIVQMIDCCSGGMGASTILLKNYPRIGIQKRTHIWVYYLVDVCIGCEITLDYMKGGFGIECDSTPYHDIATSMPIPFFDAGLHVPLPSSSVHILLSSFPL